MTSQESLCLKNLVSVFLTVFSSYLNTQDVTLGLSIIALGQASLIKNPNLSPIVVFNQAVNSLFLDFCKMENAVTERWYRLIQGIYLIVALYIENDVMVYGFMGLLAFEAITNIRVPNVALRLATGNVGMEDDPENQCYTFSIDSERLLRVFVVAFLLLSYVMFPEPVWFFPWFVAAMLLLAGITNICPMVMMFQFVGFK